METVRIIKKTTATASALYAIKDQKAWSFCKNLQTARSRALETLKKHPGYTVAIFKIEKKEEKPGDLLRVSLKQVSTLKF